MQRPFDGADFPCCSQMQTTPMIIIVAVSYANIVQLVVYHNLLDEFSLTDALVSSSYSV